MKLEHIETKKPVVNVDRETPVDELVKTMDEYNVGCVVITDDEEPIGIVTDRDVALACGTGGLEPTTVIAEDIMRSPIKTIEAGSSLVQVIQTMASAGVRRLPVVEEEKLVDIVTMDDIVRLSAQILDGLGDIIENESPQSIADFLEEAPA